MWNYNQQLLLFGGVFTTSELVSFGSKPSNKKAKSKEANCSTDFVSRRKKQIPNTKIVLQY